MSKPQRPKVSRKPLVLLIALCLALSAILIPAGSHLPKWVEAEIVMGVWWLIWVCVLAWLLFCGHVVDDDAHAVKFGIGKPSGLFELFGDIGCLLGDGCAGAVVGVIVALLVGLAVAVLIEFIVPAVAILLLASIGGMFARAVNDRHECQGRFGPAVLWALAWATLYIAPVAAIVISLSRVLHKT